MTSLRPRFLVLALACATVIALAGSSPAHPGERERVVVLGFDGASADTTERLLKAGKLPNLAALAARGGSSRLTPSNPAQSPVSWASLTTGWNPGKTGIYDFLTRQPTPFGVHIKIGLADDKGPEIVPIPGWARGALVGVAGVIGAAAGVGLVLALYAGGRRSLRPPGMMQGTMTGSAALFASAAYVVLGWVPASLPTPRNLRSGDAFWVTLDRAGVRCIALEAPLSFPADEMHSGCCHSGLGVPDVQMTWGTHSLWTDDPQSPAWSDAQGSGRTEMGGTAFFVQPGAASFDLVLVGPPLPSPDRAKVGEAEKLADTEAYKRSISQDWALDRRRASATSEALLRLTDDATVHVKAEIERNVGVHLTTPEGVRVDLLPGKWSELVPVVFHMTPIARVHARVRFLLESAPSVRGTGGAPWRPMRLHVAPVQFDPAALPPNVRLSSPQSLAAELAHDNGVYETLGWPELTNPVKDDVMEDRSFLDHVDLLRKGREKRFLDRLRRGGWDCAFALFSEPDRVQHVLYRHVDDKSPRHDRQAAPLFAGEIDRAYAEMDRFVGEVVRLVGPETQVVVCSDHGFAPFRRGVNLNNFLCANGFQARTGNGGPLGVGDLKGGKKGFFPDVDWAETKAYSMGLGNVYLNLEGREKLGSVKKADANAVLAEIEAKLLELKDQDGTKVVRRVYRGKDLYHGDRAAEAPDLVVGFEWGYRVSWQCCLGGCDSTVIVPNTQRWSGDHCSVDPELVPGILFSSVPLQANVTPGVEDVAPSLLSLFGVAPRDPDGRNVFAR